MIRSSQKVILPLSVILAVGVVFYMTLKSDAVGSYVREKIIEVGREKGLSMKMDNVACGILGCKAEGVTVSLQHAFMYLRIDELNIRPKFVGILLGGPQLRMTGQLYRGNFISELRIQPKESIISGSVIVTGLEVAEIPQLSGIGLVAGTLDFTLNSIVVKPDSLGFASGEVRIVGASKPQKTSLPPLLTGAALPIDIPAMREVNVQMIGQMRDDKLTLKEGRLASSLGLVQMEGEVSFSQKSRSVGLGLNGRIELSKEGTREISSLIGLEGKGVDASAAQKFDFQLRGTAENPDFTYKPVS
ncbi:MAG: type II secretion system protein GspN [SAR324 cluster bacterium]|uniref:Type II secretion system protein GspN n=1 Tax=SAR324 cluster bacterium TaxID=2024889 RepID=A0A7X9IJE3_9DELT|nr:type II secretion system protein GspN [SAR324 cluster bacterium]